MPHNPIIEQTALTTRLTVTGDYREFVNALHLLGDDKLCDAWARFVHQYTGNLSDNRATIHATDFDAMMADMQAYGKHGYASHAVPAELNGLPGVVLLAARRGTDNRHTWSVSAHT